MKKALVICALVAFAAVMSSCGSLRTPATGKNQNLNYYHTFFGISLESAVYGDGLIVNGMNNK